MLSDKNRRVLIIDDNRDIHDDFRKILCPDTATAAALDASEAALFGLLPDAAPEIRFEVDSAYQGQEGVLCVQKALAAGLPYAMAFVDVRMPPGWDGLETTLRIWELDPNLQVVLCTAYSDYSWGEIIQKLGQRDGFLILKKPFDAVEASQLAHALTEKWWLHQQSRRKLKELEGLVAERTGELQQSNHALQAEVVEHKHAEETLRESDERFSSAFKHAPIGVALVSPDGRWLKVNRALCDLVGYSEAELLIRTFQDITDPADLESDLENVRQMISGEIQSYQIEKRYVHKRGHFITVLLSVSLVRDAQGRPRFFVSQIQDITERKRLEVQLFQSQKLETVGKLVGGIAHEFNSILTVIIGQSELLLAELPSGSPLVKNATEISKAVGRASTLTQQLLASGRKQTLRLEVLDLNSVLAGMESSLRQLMGHGVAVRIACASGLGTVKADAGQIEQVIMNLATNAADAMPNGGELTLETANVTLDREQDSRFPEMKPGEYVVLAIKDTGEGMSEEIKARLFEPFFTTKGIGQGTGLGLSTCYGIIKQSGGHISVASELAQGSTFKIYLPQVERPAAIPLPRLHSPDLPRGTETILMVEDDPNLRDMAVTLLRRLGYTVLTAADGLEALNLNQQRDAGHIDLLFTDAALPQMSGKELSKRVRALHPDTRIVFTSTYGESNVSQQDMLTKGVGLLQKPFSPSALAHKLREVLDQSGAPSRDNVQKAFEIQNNHP
jgi:two-component system cell cycle sensor histidine kinase/response regulator CckA